jgi:hypothetical protein
MRSDDRIRPVPTLERRSSLCALHVRSRTPRVLERVASPFERSLQRGGAVPGPWAVSSAENCRLSWGSIVTGPRWEVKYLRKWGLYGIWQPNRWGLSRHIPPQDEPAYETRRGRPAGPHAKTSLSGSNGKLDRPRTVGVASLCPRLSMKGSLPASPIHNPRRTPFFTSKEVPSSS